MSSKLRAALITEWHPIDVINFYGLFHGFEDLNSILSPLISSAGRGQQSVRCRGVLQSEHADARTG